MACATKSLIEARHTVSSVAAHKDEGELITAYLLPPIEDATVKEAMMKKATFLVLALIAMFAFSTAVMAADGAAIFKTKCAACHGPDASGATPMGQKMKIRDLRSADVQKQTDADLTAMIATGGKDAKPAHAFKTKGLSDGDITALVTFIRSIKK